MKNLALKVFRAPPQRLNCAQAVAAAWHQTTGRNAALVTDLGPCGGGRAPGGVCGALHAAQVIAGDEAVGGQMARQFAETAGGLSCRDIRRRGLASCADCVALAAEILATSRSLTTTDSSSGVSYGGEK